MRSPEAGLNSENPIDLCHAICATVGTARQLMHDVDGLCIPTLG